MRSLLITRRRIPPGESHNYMQVWNSLRTAAEQHGARAWIFRSIQDAAHFTEFVEWQQPHFLQQAGVASALDALNAAFPAEESDTWTEVTA